VFLKPKVAMSSNELWPILAIQQCLGGILKTFFKKKDVSYTLNDFIV